MVSLVFFKDDVDGNGFIHSSQCETMHIDFTRSFVRYKVTGTTVWTTVPFSNVSHIREVGGL